MITSIIIYAVFVLPFALSVYSQDKGSFRIVKILNLIITFYFFLSLSSSFKQNISYLRNNFSELNEVLFIQVGIIPPIINYSGFFLYTIALFIMLATLIGLAVRHKNTYYSLKYIIPFLCVLNAIDMHFRFFYDLKEFAPIDDWIIFIYSLGISILHWAIFFIIYHLKWFRRFFNESGLKGMPIFSSFNSKSK